MARDVSLNVRHRALLAVVAHLKTITRSRGYNTQPLVTTDPRMLPTQRDVACLLVQAGNERVLDNRAGLAWVMELEVVIYGYAPIGAGCPMEAADALLQDTRTAISTNLRAIRDDLDRGGAVTFGDTQTDEGRLLEEGWASFATSVLVQYHQGEIW